MKTACTLALCLVASLQFSTASAQTYQWKDSTGRTVISDTPPPTTAKSSRAVAVNQAAESSAPKTTAEKDMDFKKRQQEAKQKAEKDTAAADKKDNCERAKQHLALLESEENLVVREESGERRNMEAGQRQKETERVRRILESCK